MAQDIVGSLFGVNPNAIMNQRINAEMDQAINFANLSPAQQANYGGFLAGQMLGRGVGGLLGAQDPALQQASVIREAQQQGFDVTTPEGLQQLAQFFIQRGQPGLASQVAQQVLAQRQTLATTAKNEEDLLRGQQYRAAIAELNANPNATEEDYIRLQRQFTSPEAGLNASINMVSKQEAAQAKAEAKAQVDAEKQRQAAELAFGRATNIVSTVDEALNLVTGRTAGPLGQQLKAIGGTGAADLESKLKTVKSLLAVTELQKIREASKTGGALGNVSNKDIDLLESTIANLDQKQSPDSLRKSLQKVQEIYTKILRDAGLVTGQVAPQTPAAAPAQVDTKGWSIVTK